ncbi:hypothetical protein GCM10029978_108380 [Actinoallomurus acanthiterrae]
MRIRKWMALATSGAALAGTTALGLGAAVPAGAQVTAAPHGAGVTASHHDVAGHMLSGIRTGGWGYGYGYGGYGYGYGGYGYGY